MLLTELKQKIKVLELEPSGGGCFEIHVDGREIYSKLKTDEFPVPADILKALSGGH